VQIERRHFGRIAEPRSNGAIGEVDIRELVHRLVLFDECIIESTGLRELPPLVSSLGPDGVLRLIYSGALRFIGDVLTAGQVGQAANVEGTAGDGILPLGSFRLAAITLAKGSEYRNQYLDNALDQIGLLRVRPEEASKLRLALRSRLEEYPTEATRKSLIESVEDIVGGNAMLRGSVRDSAIKLAGSDPGPDFDLSAVRLDDESDFRVQSDLQHRLAITPEQEHKIVERAALGIAGFNQRLHLMNSLEALTGFRDDERQLFDRKVALVARELNAANRQDSFSRVVTLGALERYAQGTQPTIDVKRLMKLRESPEVHELRAWVATVGSLTDQDIASQFSSRRGLIAARLGSPFGRAVRFVVATGVGGPSPVAGFAASAIDTFFIDRVIGRPGPAVFLGRAYPSIFN